MGDKINENDESIPQVLFMDYNGIWCGLSSLYWSQSSKILVSKHLYSSLEEIISQFCPQCMTRFTEDEVNNYLGRCPSCYQCPCCTSTLATTINESSLLILCCGMCYWRSDESGIIGVDKAEIDALVLHKEKDGIEKQAFNLLLAKCQKEESLVSMRSVSSVSEFSRNKQKQSDGKSVWRMEDLEQHLEETQKKLTAPEPYLFAQFVDKVQTQQHEKDNKVFNAQCSSLFVSRSQQLNNYHSLPNCIDELSPVRMRLRTKRTLRCKHDMELGKMNILVQSKVFPLEGDSSLKVQRGKWWVKDSSAVHQLPFVSLLRLPAKDTLRDGHFSYLEISITNPLEADVVVSFLDLAVAHTTNDNQSSSNSSSSSSSSSGQAPYYLLNQFHLPIDTTRNVLLASSALPRAHRQGTTGEGEEEEVSGRVDIALSAFEDELLKDSDSATASRSSAANAAETHAGDVSDTSPRWRVTVDLNIAHVTIPVRLQSGHDILDNSKLELKLIAEMKADQSSPVRLPIRIIF